MKNTFVLGLIAGVCWWSSWITFCTKKGEETRKDIKDTIDNLANKGKEFYDQKLKNQKVQEQQQI
jgi:hypothetical protein